MNLRLQSQLVSLISYCIFHIRSTSLVLEWLQIGALLVVLWINGILGDGFDVNLNILTLVTVIH